MTANTNDPIANFIGITPATQEIVPVVPTPVSIANTIIQDIDYARTNIYELIEAGQSTLVDLLQIAQQAQNAKVYEVLVALIKTMSQTNLDLIELQLKKKQLIVNQDDKPNVVNNNLILSTGDLLKMIKKKVIENGEE